MFPDTNAHDRKTEIAEFVVRLRNHLYSLFRYSSKLFLNLSLSLSCTVSCCRHLKEVIRFINHGVFESCLGGAPGGIGYSAALSWTISSYRRNTCLKQPISILRRVANRVYGERPAIRDLLWWSSHHIGDCFGKGSHEMQNALSRSSSLAHYLSLSSFPVTDCGPLYQQSSDCLDVRYVW